MKVAAVTAEYNPFHKGHEYQLNRTRDMGATHIVAVMSGHFTQRGECACLSKFARAEAALACGADLVVELPLPWVLAPAARFASGGVDIINALGCVDFISFGSECGDTQCLYDTAEAVKKCDAMLKDAAKQGGSLAASRYELVSEHFGQATAAALSMPNDTLGVEYILAASRLDTPIPCAAVKRSGAGHDSLVSDGENASASLIRSLLPDGQWEGYVPDKCAEITKRELDALRAPASMGRLERAMLAKLRMMGAEDIGRCFEASEGLENRIADKLRRAVSLEDLYSSVKTKRYTHSRIRRLLLSAFFEIPAEVTASSPPYIRVLGMNGRGREILSSCKPTLPLITRPSDIKNADKLAREVFRLECKAGDIWALSTPTPLPCGMDMTAKFIWAE